VTGVKETLKEFQLKVHQEKENKKKNIAEDLVADLKEATPVDTGRARDGWKYENSAITNDVEYIEKLNSGSSAQAPSHFIETTLLRHPGVKPNGTIIDHSDPIK
jgi:hypothetical protein